MTLQALAIAGPTACGKSGMALSLAAALNGEIISVDSGAVYCDMNIGTAKPTPAMRDTVRHHLIDICSPNELFNVGKFCHLANNAVQDIQKRGKLPILAGGTMMYFQALTAGLHRLPTSPAAVRRAIRNDLQKMGVKTMYRQLAATDAATAMRLAPTDAQRITRALEIITATGKPMSAWQDGNRQSLLPKMPFVLLMPSSREQLRRRIATRLAQMFVDGLIQETRQLLTRWQLPPAAPPLRLVGYSQVAAFLRGEINESAMRSKTYYATCQLAKRQLTWIRRWPPPLATLDPFAADTLSRLIKLAAQ